MNQNGRKGMQKEGKKMGMKLVPASSSWHLKYSTTGLFPKRARKPNKYVHFVTYTPARIMNVTSPLPSKGPSSFCLITGKPHLKCPLLFWVLSPEWLNTPFPLLQDHLKEMGISFWDSKTKLLCSKRVERNWRFKAKLQLLLHLVTVSAVWSCDTLS